MKKVSEKPFPLETKHFYIAPEDEGNLFESEWKITLKDGNKDQVGTIHFEDGMFHDDVKMNVDLEHAYEKTKIISEIFFSMARFVFRFKNIREISTVCRHEDDHRVRGLEKAGYVYRQNKDGCDYYSMKKQKTSWTGLYVFIGLIAGFIIGITLSNLWMGTVIGLLVGTIIGILLDKKEQSREIDDAKAQ